MIQRASFPQQCESVQRTPENAARRSGCGGGIAVATGMMSLMGDEEFED
jgi:hypothetical protein